MPKKYEAETTLLAYLGLRLFETSISIIVRNCNQYIDLEILLIIAIFLNASITYFIRQF